MYATYMYMYFNIQPSVAKANKDRGNYDQYHNYLDKLDIDRQAKNASPKPSPQGMLS